MNLSGPKLVFAKFAEILKKKHLAASFQQESGLEAGVI